MKRVIRSDIFYGQDGNLDVDFYQDQHGGITTVPGKTHRKQDQFANEPYIAQDKLLNGHKVYSVYAFTGDNYVDIFKGLKQGKMEKTIYREWVQYTADYIWGEILSKDRPDIIAVPQSSSSLVEDVAKATVRSSQYTIEYLPNAFIKNPVSDITIEDPNGFPLTESVKKSAVKVLEQIRRKGVFESKAVPKRLLKFFRNIYTNDDEYVELLEGKKVAVLDDSMTSKSTMMNIFDVCDYLYDCAESYGVTIFKKSGSRN